MTAHLVRTLSAQWRTFLPFFPKNATLWGSVLERMSKMKTRAISRAGRKGQIMLYLQLRQQKLGADHFATAGQIARAIGLVPSTHVRNMCDELVDEGQAMSWQAGGWGVTSHRNLYGCRHENPRKLTPKIRSVPIKNGGKVVGQLDLFYDS